MGEIDVSLNGTGVAISGDREQVNLSGDINVIQERDGSGTFPGRNGHQHNEQRQQYAVDGNINVTSSMGTNRPPHPSR